MSVTIGRIDAAELPKLLTLLELSGLPRDGVSDHLSTAVVAPRGRGCRQRGVGVVRH